MDDADKAALGFIGVFAGAAALAGVTDYLMCQTRNQRFIQQGQLDQCLLPAIQSAFLSGLLAAIFGPIPLPLQVAQFMFQNRDLLQNPCHTRFWDPHSGRGYSVCAQPYGGWTVSFA